MKWMTLLAVGACAFVLAGCDEDRRGYGRGYGYERSTLVVGDDWRDRQDRRYAESKRERWEERRRADRDGWSAHRSDYWRGGY